MCKTCGGLIGEPNKAYGWAGKWCRCAPRRLSMNEPGEMDRLREEVRRLHERLDQAERMRHFEPRTGQVWVDYFSQIYRPAPGSISC